MSYLPLPFICAVFYHFYYLILCSSSSLFRLIAAIMILLIRVVYLSPIFSIRLRISKDCLYGAYFATTTSESSKRRVSVLSEMSHNVLNFSTTATSCYTLNPFSLLNVNGNAITHIIIQQT